MNCQQMQDLLIDMVYGELDEPRRAEAQAHLAGCEACRAELKQLQTARAALAAHRAGEPAGMRTPVVVPVAPPLRRIAAARRPSLWGSWAAVAALLALACLLTWMWQGSSPRPVQAQPMEIRKLGVSVTIFSTPQDWPAKGMPVKMRGQADYTPYPGWTGLALVRDERMVRHLAPGRSRVSFTDVPSGIEPDTVHLSSVAPADAFKILEQNYQFDLASSGALLKRYVDQQVALTFKDKTTAAGTLLSFDDDSLVIRPANEGPRTVVRKDIDTLSLAKLPEGLLTRPTLVWDLQNQAAAADQQFDVAYMTSGLDWRADYVLTLHPAKGSAPATQPGQEPAILDRADLVGYATVTNHSGVTYENAQLKLMAGDVNLIKPDVMEYRLESFKWKAEMALVGEKPEKQFQEKSFFEYHLYTLNGLTTLGNAETKQLGLVDGKEIGLVRAYMYDPWLSNASTVSVVSQMKNSQANGLGKPLPKGVVRLYAPDPEGQSTYVAQTTIDHTPVDEMVRLPWGYAFDLVGSFTQREESAKANELRQVSSYELRNHKDQDVTVTVIAHVPDSTYKAECNFPWHVRQVGTIEIQVPVKANSAATATLHIYSNNESGGGLVSPFDEKKP